MSIILLIALIITSINFLIVSLSLTVSEDYWVYSTMTWIVALVSSVGYLLYQGI